jgi:hypothetical protein
MECNPAQLLVAKREYSAREWTNIVLPIGSKAASAA